jgi:hypothetical protein
MAHTVCVGSIGCCATPSSPLCKPRRSSPPGHPPTRAGHSGHRCGSEPGIQRGADAKADGWKPVFGVQPIDAARRRSPTDAETASVRGLHSTPHISRLSDEFWESRRKCSATKCSAISCTGGFIALQFDAAECRKPRVFRLCGRNSVAECSLPKADVVGSNPIARSFTPFLPDGVFCCQSPPFHRVVIAAQRGRHRRWLSLNADQG